jgi:hypothetical protein
VNFEHSGSSTCTGTFDSRRVTKLTEGCESTGLSVQMILKACRASNGLVKSRTSLTRARRTAMTTR